MNNDLRDEQTARINIYALLSRLTMNEVDEGLLKSIEEDENMLSFFPTYKDWDKRKKFDRKELIEEHLNVDFTNLFLLHLIPYESFYMRDDQMMETGGENSIQTLFSDFDFRVELDKARVMSADHIGVELEFMYKLAEAQMKAFEDKDYATATELAELQYYFLQEHLVEWAPLYLINVKSEAGTPFYFDLADFVLEFILSDFQYIADMKENGYKFDAQGDK